ncbi:hypothetical protein F5Y02DRAFT_420106 [Annulohypoxylon stygium]|nr:hypothetical protein F5Y02DRAFT_420106 [Annulohypoxylon stygium]
MDTSQLFQSDGMVAVITSGGTAKSADVGFVMAEDLSNDLSWSIRSVGVEDTSAEEFMQALYVNITGTFSSALAFLEILDAGNKQAQKGVFRAPERQGSDVPSIQSQLIITTSFSGQDRCSGLRKGVCALV